MKFSAAYMSVVAFLAMKACATPVNVTQRETVATPQLKTGAANEVDLLTVCTDPGCKGDCSTDKDCSGFESFLKTSTEIEFQDCHKFGTADISLPMQQVDKFMSQISSRTLVRPKPIARRYLGRDNTLVRREDVERRLKINNLPSRDREEMAVQALASVAIRLARKNVNTKTHSTPEPDLALPNCWEAVASAVEGCGVVEGEDATSEVGHTRDCQDGYRLPEISGDSQMAATAFMVLEYSRPKIPYGRDYETVPVSTGVPRMTPSKAHLVIKDGKTSNCGVRGDADHYMTRTTQPGSGESVSDYQPSEQKIPSDRLVAGILCQQQSSSRIDAGLDDRF
ncbi:hypothetical protein C8J56DRAFT_898861 [Mycena floridula]|nr:hypothetical protein C8J56DRAFT_898861 [Mycena floridula]